jgi:hypothetical protein
MKTKAIPTVFTNSGLGKVLQKMWLQEQSMILAQNYSQQKTDFILVVPDDGTPQARVMFCELTMLNESDFEEFSIYVDKIQNYVAKNKAEDRMVVIFLSNEGRISYYTIRKVM